MRIWYAFFAAKRYWTDEEELKNAYLLLSRELNCEEASSLITEASQLSLLPQADCLVVVPMSGAVQKNILDAAARYPSVLLYAAYVKGNAPDAITSQMLCCNAAPTVMDTWAVLHREYGLVRLVVKRADLDRFLRLYHAFFYLHHAKLLLIGKTEPWVVSNSRDLSSYSKRLGVTIQTVAQEELAEKYRQTARREAQPYESYFSDSAECCIEPTHDDLFRASRMAYALDKLLEEYGAQGAAIACFNLLSEGTTACLGVSYLNGCTDKIAACEGDLDSAVTMLLMKQLAGTSLWMANPGLQPDGTVNFSHCTAPVHVFDQKTLPYVLRSHHESGIGVSLQVEMPIGQTVTACRISDEAGSITIQKGVTVSGAYEAACRTQMYVRFENPDHYLSTALGCHQIFAFEDLSEDLKELSQMLGLQIL